MNINDILSNLNADYATITDLIPNLYKFDDEGDSNAEINDGGHDMFDDANFIYTNLAGGEGGEEGGEDSGIPYTHTQREDGGEEDGFDESIGYLNPPMDGAVAAGDDYFGSGSSYFTNMYPGLFVMVATDCNISEFGIVGNIGADGGGTVTVYDPFTITTTEGNFTCYTKCVDESGDPSINHIFIVPSGGSVEHTWDDSTDSDDDTITTETSFSSVFYLLTARCVDGGEDCNGERLSESNIQEVAEQFLTVIFGEVEHVTPREQIIIHPEYTFQVIGYDPQQFCGQLLPDTMENILYQLNNRTVWIERVGAFKHGDQFTRSGALAQYLKKLYVDVASPSLSIVTNPCSDEDVLCDGECSDLMTDTANCGECGNVCDDDEMCVEGECVPDPSILESAVHINWDEYAEFDMELGVSFWVSFEPPSTNSTVYIHASVGPNELTNDMITPDNIQIFTAETFPDQIGFSEGVNAFAGEGGEYWGVYFGDTIFEEGVTYYAKITPILAGSYNIRVGFD